MTIILSERAVLRVKCNEPEGEKIRTVYRLSNDNHTASLLFKRLEGKSNMFSIGKLKTLDQVIESIRKNPDLMLYGVDNVGVLAITDIVPFFGAEVHMSFWDRRLRGREMLILEMVEYVKRQHMLDHVYTAMPVSAKVTKAFCQRIGFLVSGYQSGAGFDAEGNVDDVVWLTY